MKTQKTTSKIFTPKDTAKYDLARRLYFDKVPLKEIAERIEVTPQTLTNWKKKGAWEERRNAEILSPKTLYSKLLKQLNELIEAGDPLQTADAISKICKQIKDLQRDTTLDDTIQALSEFGDWLIHNGKELHTDKKFLQELTRFQDIYIQEQISKASLFE